MSPRSATISLLLPSSPVDVYVGGVLVKQGVTGKFEMTTPDLAPGHFKYELTVADASNTAQRNQFVINQIEAGKLITVDLRS